jgi:hypothetical protein
MRIPPPNLRIDLDAARDALAAGETLSSYARRTGHSAVGVRRYTWRGQKERAKKHELVVTPGHRPQWGLVIMSELAAIETILTRVGAP